MNKKMLKVAILTICAVMLCACAQPVPTEINDDGTSPVTWREQYDLGMRYLTDGMYEEAVIAFTAAIEIDPKQAVAYVGRGNAYIGSGETEENLHLAKSDYENAIELDETYVEAYLGLADVYIRQGDYEKSLEILRTGLEKTGGNEAIEDKISEMESGSISDSSGQIRMLSFFNGDGTLRAYQGLINKGHFAKER